ncbi:uncharacterized protein LOC141631576 [Silene latifolia]|uniref:uncharacterized protein LOC141631576 n=1 Tax=Silene latifolia TaxID=37657 RepID=UPI003D771DBB
MGIREWVEGRWKELDEEGRELMMVGCWAIWEARNRVVFEDTRVEVGAIVKRVWDVVGEMEGARLEGLEQEKGDDRKGAVAQQKGWRVPEEGWVKLNVDAGVKEGVGVVCRDAVGSVCWGLAIQRREVWDPRIAEAVAVLDGMEEAARMGHDRIVVEGDCLEVMEALKQRKSGRSSFVLVIDDILNICSLFTSVRWSHVSRINNGVAHALAHVLPVSVGRSVWNRCLPDVVSRLLEL